MVLEVEWTDKDGRHQGMLTNELEELAGKPIIIGRRGGRHTAKDLFGHRVKILSTKSQGAKTLVEQARAAGYLIGW
jgi:hypothetical protein